VATVIAGLTRSDTTFNPEPFKKNKAMSIQYLDFANMAITAIAGIVGWYVGRRKQKNDFLSELQSSIDLLSERNKLLVEELLKVREENLIIRIELAGLREENKALRAEIEALKLHLETGRAISVSDDENKGIRSGGYIYNHLLLRVFS